MKLMLFSFFLYLTGQPTLCKYHNLSTITFKKNLDRDSTPIEASDINNASWKIFMQSNNEDELKGAALQMSKVVQNSLKDPFYRDTYANLLYKLSNTKKAIKEEKKALGLLNDVSASNMAVTYYKMLIGQPTWRNSEIKFIYKNEKRIWVKVKSALTHFSNRSTDSIIAVAKIKYAKGLNNAAFVEQILSYVSQFGSSRNAIQLNQDAWDIFNYSSNSEYLSLALQWSILSLKDTGVIKYHYAFQDTYANLLYKMGSDSAAIIAQRKAIQLCPEEKKAEYIKTLNKMLTGQSTWIH